MHGCLVHALPSAIRRLPVAVGIAAHVRALLVRPALVTIEAGVALIAAIEAALVALIIAIGGVFALVEGALVLITKDVLTLFA